MGTRARFSSLAVILVTMGTEIWAQDAAAPPLDQTLDPAAETPAQGQFAMKATDAAGNPLPGDLATGRQNLPEDLKNPVKLDENNVEVSSGVAQVESVSWPVAKDGQQSPPIDSPTTQAQPEFKDPGHYEVSNKAKTRVPVDTATEEEGAVESSASATGGDQGAGTGTTGGTEPGGAMETEDGSAAGTSGAQTTAPKEFNGQLDLEVFDYTAPEFDFTVTEGVWNAGNSVWMTENPVDAHPGEKSMGVIARGPNFDPGVSIGEVPPVTPQDILQNPAQLLSALQAATPRLCPLYTKDSGEPLGRIFDMDIADQVKNLVSKLDLTLDRTIDRIPGGHLFVAKDTRHQVRITRLADNSEEANKPAPGVLDTDSSVVTVVTFTVEGSNPSEVEFERDADGLGGSFILRAENIDDPDARWYKLTIEVKDREGNAARTVLPLVAYKRPLGVETISTATQKKTDGE